LQSGEDLKNEFQIIARTLEVVIEVCGIQVMHKTIIHRVLGETRGNIVNQHGQEKFLFLDPLNTYACRCRCL